MKLFRFENGLYIVLCSFKNEQFICYEILNEILHRWKPELGDEYIA